MWNHRLPSRFLAAVSTAAFFGGLIPLAPAAAATPQQLAVASVVCDGRLGSGALTSLNDGGYVLTAGHVALDTNSRTNATSCRVGFLSDDTLKPTAWYNATVEHAIFDERTSRDFGILKVGQRITGTTGLPAQPLRINEFASEGQPLTIYGFPEGNDVLQSATGVIKEFRRGVVVSDAPITPGYSGGPVLDAGGNLIATADRVNYMQDIDTGIQKIIDYDLDDVLPLIAWLDSFGAGTHDKYLTHVDHAKYHGAHLVYRRENSGCTHVVNTKDSPSVFCLLNGPYRLVFPNEAVYYSWYGNFSGLKHITVQNMAEYQLIGNMSMRAGSLIKIQTDPKVYVVTDSIGTIRWVPTEQMAIELFGTNWAKQVRDVPVEFFLNYRIAEALQ